MFVSAIKLITHASDPHQSGGSVPPHSGSVSRSPEERLLGLDILIVEDEAMLAQDIAFTMEDAGAEIVGPAYSLDSALALVMEAGFHADVAILDVDLGGRDVFPVAERLRALGIPFLFHTGHGDRMHLTSMFPGAIVCMKPSLQNDLIAGVQELAARSGR